MEEIRSKFAELQKENLLLKAKNKTQSKEFSTKGIKEQWITKARQKKSLTARDVNQHFPIQRVYIND
ncbi:hypothetical protein J6590_024825 [Homalodisca vitripennis]|nr:hypothetical protein J6590_024825 [Homalodisca vitripennis]